MISKEYNYLIILLNSLELFPERWESLVNDARAAVPDHSIEYMYLVAALEIAAVKGRLAEKCIEVQQELICQEQQEAV